MLLYWKAGKTTKIYFEMYSDNERTSQIQHCTHLPFAQKLEPDNKDENSVSIPLTH